MSDRYGVIVAHGAFGEGLLSALTRVVGPQSSLVAISNDGLDCDALESRIGELLTAEAKGRESFLFTDLDGGSCCQAARRLLDHDRVVAVFCGVNLPLLIEFVFLQDLPLEEFKAAMLQKSRGALGVHA